MSNTISFIKKRSSIVFIAIVLLVAFSNVFAPSGAANALHFSDSLSILSVFGMIWLASKRMPAILDGKWYTLCAIQIGLMAVLSFLNYDAKAMQFCNFVCTFGIVFWVQLFSTLKWERKDLFWLGLCLCALSFFLNYQFLPGQAWSGWNANSSISVVPIMFMGVACIWCSDHKLSHWLIIPIFLLYGSVISALDNRSALYSVILFCLIVLCRKPVLNKKSYRILYVSVILFNVLVPYLNEFIADTDFFNDVIGVSPVGADKEGGFNGRESIWAYAISLNAEHPLFGLSGVRPIYPHNFSMDLLVEFGWIGWLTFFGMVVAIMEKVFRENSKYNVFPVAFICIIFLNTFENVFACCNMLVVFSFMLPSVALSIHRSGYYDTLGYKLFATK